MFDYINEFNEVPLTIPSVLREGDNTFTVIVGKNGVGKSRLLAEMLVNHKYFKRRNSKVIAVSTSPFDKFKLPQRKKELVEDKYKYIGMRGGGQNSSAIALISSATKGLIRKLLLSNDDSQLSNIFKLLGFSSQVEFIFKSTAKNKSIFDKRFYEIINEAFEVSKGKSNWLADVSHKLDEETYNAVANLGHYTQSEIEFALQYFAQAMDVNSGVIRVNVSFNENDKENRIDELKAIDVLFDAGVIKLMDLQLKKFSLGKMSLRRASSGEQCIMVIMLGIAGHIEDHSLVFIDEPEISLHPIWQEKFVEILIKLFSSYKHCQFFIATHSPQIVSKLEFHNCFITSLSKRKIFLASELGNRSSDFQLAEVFDAPGSKNEYINRLCFSLLSKLKSKKEINHQDEEQLNKLLEFSNWISREDATYELIMSVKEVFDFYAVN